VKILADTHILLWASDHPRKLSRVAAALLTDNANEIYFSPMSIWEVAIKGALGRKDFMFDPRVLRRNLLDNGYTELPVTSEHAIAVQGLPLIHKDPIDRLLMAQAQVEGFTFLTADAKIAISPGAIRKV
jgi:PIN domain nuclease of toxin-antitoxin system